MLKTRELRKLMDTIDDCLTERVITETTEKTWLLALQFSIVEAEHGADADDVIETLLDNELVYDGEDIRKYAKNLIDEEVTEIDCAGAKILYVLTRLEFSLEELIDYDY